MSQKTEGFCAADFTTLPDERRLRSKIFLLFNADKSTLRSKIVLLFNADKSTLRSTI